MTSSARYGLMFGPLLALVLLAFLWKTGPSESDDLAPRPQSRPATKVEVNGAPDLPAPTVATPSPPTGGKPSGRGPSCILRSLADGSPLPGIEMRQLSHSQPTSAQDEAARVSQTGPLGEFEYLSSSSPSVSFRAGELAVPAQRAEEVLASGTLWAYRTIEVRGVVKAADGAPPLDYSAVQLLLLPTGDGLVQGASLRVESPGTQEWLEAHGLRDWPRRLGHPAGDGTFVVKVPQIQGMSVVADASGWRASVADVPMTVDAAPLELVLLPGVQFVGTVRMADGSAVAGARIVVYVTVTGDFASGSAGRTWARQPEGGMSGIRDPRNGTSRTAFHRETRSNKKGEFRLSAKVEGEARLCVFAAGCAPVDMELGIVAKDKNGIDVVVSPAADSRPIVLRNGLQPLSGMQVLVSDQSGSFEQPTLTYTLDANGALCSDWFVSGKMYAFISMGPKVPSEVSGFRYMLWRGENDIDLSNLPTSKP